MQLQSGERIESYILETHLGHGGVGDVWRAVHSETSEQVAIKVLHSAASDLPTRLTREAKFQRTIVSPHVVQVVDLLEFQERPVIVMELVEGPTLRHWLASYKGMLPIEKVDEIAMGLFEGVQAAHSIGLVHRDLKPSNILLAAEGDQVVPKIADFGLARSLKPTDLNMELTQPGLGMGTPGYMAPEQIRDASSVDQRADVFALGAIFYLLCTGQRAFIGANRFDVLRRTTDGSYTPPMLLRRDLPHRMAYAIRLALETAPSDRPETVESMRALWNSSNPPMETQDFNWTLTDFKVETRGTRDEPTLTVGEMPRVTGDIVGRDTECNQLVSMLYEHPIVTLIGPGGVGKTRLSIEVAQHVALGVVWFCELAEVTDRVGVCEVVAEQLGIKLQMQDPVIQVGRAISARRDSLVILDNAEQAADAVAEALLVWQPMAPNTRFLVTSRQPLQLGIERPFLLNPLAEEDAVRLFIARARRHAPMFTVTEEGVRTLNQIVEQLDYLPLAIELAAARASLLEPTQILERLDHRFHLLRARERGRSDRQATLRGTILWSWDMLPPWTRLALAQCSVFRGGFSIEAAEAVIEIDAWPEAPWPMDAVHELLDRSLLRVRRGPDGNNRLTQYVSIRAFSEEKFAEEGSIEGPQGEVLTGAAAVARAYRRHGEFYAQLGNDEWLRRLHTHNGFYHLRILKIEMDNLTAGARRSVGADWEEEGAFCTLASAMVADQQGPYEEAAIVLEQALLDFTEVTSATRATLLETLGRIRSRQGKSSEALPCYLEALQEFRNQELRVREANVLRQLGDLNCRKGNFSEARAHCEEALRIQREHGDRINEGRTLNTMGTLCWFQGDMSQAEEWYRAALEVDREVGNRQDEGSVVGNLGLIQQGLGNGDAARQFYEEALAIHRETGNHRSQSNTLCGLGTLCEQEGQVEEAVAHLTDALMMSRKTGDRPVEGNVLLNFGHWHQNQGRFTETLAHYEQALEIFREIGDQAGEGTILNNIGNLLLDQGRMGEAEERLIQARDLHRRLSQRQHEGRVIGNLGNVWFEKGAFDRAEEHYLAALEIHRQVHDRRFEGVVVGNLANLYGLTERSEEAINSFDKAMAIHRALKHLRFEGIVFGDRGRFHHDRSQWEDAHKCYEQACAILGDVDDRQGEGLVHANLGMMALEHGESGAAQEAFERAVNVLDGLDHPAMAMSHGELALLSGRSDELRLARQGLSRYLEHFSADYFFRRMGLLCVLCAVDRALGEEHAAQAAFKEIHANLIGQRLAADSALMRRIRRLDDSAGGGD